MPAAKRSISSRVTIQNPRPRKYASAAERQKALRERFPTLCVRVEQEQADFMKRIADEQGRTLQDVHLAFIKYANGRGNLWLTQGLKGFAPLPRFEEPKENPMKRKPTPAQIAARERFAEMARSGAFKKKAAKRKTTDKNKAISEMILERVERGESVKSAYDAVLGKGAYERLAGDLYDEIRKTKSNPRKKTVSEKISQLSREGYPQKQAVAIALSEERAGKVKRNPRASNPIVLVTDRKPSKRKANPQAPSIKHKGARNIAYAVEAKRMLASGGSQFEMIAGFPTKAQAQDYIDALLKSYPKGLTLRISAA